MSKVDLKVNDELPRLRPFLSAEVLRVFDKRQRAGTSPELHSFGRVYDTSVLYEGDRYDYATRLNKLVERLPEHMASIDGALSPPLSIPLINQRTLIVSYLFVGGVPCWSTPDGAWSYDVKVARAWLNAHIGDLFHVVGEGELP